MTRLLEIVQDNRRSVIRGAIALGLVLLSVTLLLRARPDGRDKPGTGPELYADVERAISGQKIKINDSEPLMYAGIRAPYPKEPLFEESLKRNAELVEKKRIRLRFDDEKVDRKGRQSAYVFVEDQFINETLVREGLAYVRLTESARRFADRLLAAQNEAVKNRRGLWNLKPESNEKSYAADSKYGNFHRPNCDDVAKIKPDRLLTIATRSQAFSKGFAPCDKCHP